GAGPPRGRGPASPPRTAGPHGPNVVVDRGAGDLAIPSEGFRHQRRHLTGHVGSARPVLERQLRAAAEDVLERQGPLALDRLDDLGPRLRQGGDERFTQTTILRHQLEELVEPAPVATGEMLEHRRRETMTIAGERGGGENLRPGGPS